MSLLHELWVHYFSVWQLLKFRNSTRPVAVGCPTFFSSFHKQFFVKLILVIWRRNFVWWGNCLKSISRDVVHVNSPKVELILFYFDFLWISLYVQCLHWLACLWSKMPIPLLISTDFLKYPFWHLFQTGIKFQFVYNWNFFSVLTEFFFQF